MPNDRRTVKINSLYREVRSVLEQARASAYRAVNTAMVHAYWNIGRLIVEHEQGGKRRAVYGEAVLEDLSSRLTAEFGRGFDMRNLRYMRQFYLAYPIRNALRADSAIRHAARDESPGLREDLSWTHYRLLLGVENPAARTWYMNEAADQHWSTRQIERQISAHARPAGDNPTIGLILCSRKNEAIARYSVLAEGRQIFAAKYLKILPTEEELRQELERERRSLALRDSSPHDKAGTS